MRAFPDIPPVDDAPEELLAGGHLWVLELVDGGPLRFRLRGDGRVEFGDDEGTFGPGSVPAHYRAAVRHVRESLDRAALDAAVEDASEVVFFGVSTHRRGVDYDWDRTPPFLGTEVWDGDLGAFLPPDAVERACERLGLAPANALAKEVRAVDFDPATYDLPASAWYDGPAAGVVLRDKTGNRARIDARGDVHDAADGRIDPATRDPEELAAELAGEPLVAAVRERLAAGDRPAGTDAVVDRVLEAVYRRAHGRIDGGAPALDGRAFRSAVADRVSTLLAER